MRRTAIHPTRRAAPECRHRWTRYRAACAHAYTISGGLLALAAFIATAERQFNRAFLFLAFAFAVDATDGMLARRFAVTTHCPGIDGERLDALVDFMTWVVVPAFIAAVAGVVPAPVLLWAGAMVVASLVRFSRRSTKEGDRFKYLPSCWNVLVFYAFYLGVPPALVGACTATMVALMFVPGYFPHPVMHASRRWHIAVASPAVAIVIGVAARVLPARPWLMISLAYPAFYGAQAIWLTLEGAARTRPATSPWRRLFSAIIGNYQRADCAA